MPKHVGTRGLGIPHGPMQASGLVSLYGIGGNLPGFVKKAVRRTHAIEKRHKRRQERQAAKRGLDEND